MFPILFLIFVLTPIIEITLFIEVGGMIGAPATIAIVIITALLGSLLLRMQGTSVIRRASEAVNAGELPVEPVIDGISLLVAGALLLTPGFLTDTIGLLLFVPQLRRSLARWIFRRLARSGRIRVFEAGYGPSGGRPAAGQEQRGPAIIDVEYERVDEDSEDRDKEKGGTSKEVKRGKRRGGGKSPWTP